MNKRFRNSNKIDLPHDIDQESLLSLYDRESRDLELFNSIDAEIIKLSGSKLFYYKVFINENYDRVYLEERNKVVSKDAIVVWASYDPKPIEENVSEFGLELTNDQVFVFNKSYIERAIGRAPQPGDVVESPVQNIKYEIYEVQEDSFEVYGVFHYNCYGRVLRDSSDVVDEPALETFEEVGADLVFTRSDYEDLSVAAMTNTDITAPEAPPVIVPDPDENILALFANGEVGAWYDPSDSTTVFQDAAGTTAATVGDPVGLILDKSQGLMLGPELVTNGTFDAWSSDNPDGWTVGGENANNYITESISGARIVSDNSSALYMSQALTVESGSLIRVSITKSNHVSGSIRLQISGVAAFTIADIAGSDQNGTFDISVGVSTSTSITLYIWRDRTTNTDYVINNISVKELPGNHATQTTSTRRPVLQQSGDLYYLDFDGVDDSMSTTFAAAQAQPNSIGVGFKFDDYTSKQYDFVYDSPGTAAGPRHALFDNNTTLFATAGNAITIGSSDLADHVVTTHYNTTSSTVRLDGSVANTGDTGSYQWGGVVLGNVFSLNAGFALDGRIYSFVGINRTLTAEEITTVETYLAEKSGVTLE